MAGYLFQPDRALVLLCSCNNNEAVAIEIVDDVAIIDDTGNILYREQDKNSIVDNGRPYADRSKDLWNTLFIWISDIRNGKMDVSRTRLLCVTNKNISENSLIRKISDAHSIREIDLVIELLKSSVERPPASLQSIISHVLSSEETLKAMIAQISLLDANCLVERNDEIANRLGLNDDIRDDVITDLRGWFNDHILVQLDKGFAPIVRKTELNRRLQRTMQSIGDKRIKVLAKRYVDVTITDNDIVEAKGKVFIKQLELIDHYDKEGIIVDAIVDFFYSEDQRTRLTLMGDITGKELLAMDDLCFERWTESFRRKMVHCNINLSESELSELAFEIYDSTVNGFVVKLRGNDTEPYFTKGSFYKLSDSLDIGWHPHWEKHFKN
ncbi:ABC-three component system protein [Dyadobacter pollutisoli]|uniref:ABC-three component systems C-terminal domain-containing protein n=1 Tax=Dyadobacter pollutisoli TaxID=2910158 RepID=A0A9E8NCD4_9BACT|nr:ABC-three component system protein [Dyadobacter pollutisoli]WAC12412.1 hypothetical protein ON006_00325 [Dyadobacter pollutisoli]